MTHTITEVEYDADLNKTFGKVNGRSIWISGKASKAEYALSAIAYFDYLESRDAA